MPHVVDAVELEVTSIMDRRRREREAEATQFPGIRGTQSILPEADLIPADREQLRKNRFGAFHARTLRARRTELGPLSDTELRNRTGPAVGLSDDDLNRELMERARHRILAGQQAQARQVEGFQEAAEARRPEAERELGEVRRVGETDRQYADRLNNAGFPPDMIEQAIRNTPFIAEPERRTPAQVKARRQAHRALQSKAADAIRARRKKRSRSAPGGRGVIPAEFPGPPKRRGDAINKDDNLAYVDSIAETLTPKFADFLRRIAPTATLDRLSRLARQHDVDEDALLTPDQQDAKAELQFQLAVNEGDARALRRERSKILDDPDHDPEEIANFDARLAEMKAERLEIRRGIRAVGAEPPARATEAAPPPAGESVQTASERQLRDVQRGAAPTGQVQAPQPAAPPTGGSTQLAPGLTFQQEQQRQRSHEALKPAQPGAILSPETGQAILDHVRSFHPEAQTRDEQHELTIKIAIEMGWSFP